ncbi:hypothetical protein [Ornithinimicrobium kibberense]|uniref:hypothetical protein n=1 Tax=Ornithinimicrobium kibberense TaxID=282060 RepID=UPI003611AE59
MLRHLQRMGRGRPRAARRPGRTGGLGRGGSEPLVRGMNVSVTRPRRPVPRRPPDPGRSGSGRPCAGRARCGQSG